MPTSSLWMIKSLSPFAGTCRPGALWIFMSIDVTLSASLPASLSTGVPSLSSTACFSLALVAGGNVCTRSRRWGRANAEQSSCSAHKLNETASTRRSSLRRTHKARQDPAGAHIQLLENALSCHNIGLALWRCRGHQLGEVRLVPACTAAAPGSDWQGSRPSFAAWDAVFPETC